MATDHANINVSLPPPMRTWVDAQIEAGRYGNLSEYVRDLIRRDQERQAEKELEGALLRSLASIERGEGIEATPEFWADLRRDVAAKVKARHSGRVEGA